MNCLNINLSEIVSDPVFIGAMISVAGTLVVLLRKKNRIAKTPLIDAASNRDLETFKKLLEKKKIDVNEVNLSGQTPLILATGVWGRKYLIEELLDKGAITMLDWQDINGNTALHYAVLGNKKPLVKIFIDRGADLSIANQEGKTPLAIAAEKGKDELVAIMKNE